MKDIHINAVILEQIIEKCLKLTDWFSFLLTDLSSRFGEACWELLPHWRFALQRQYGGTRWYTINLEIMTANGADLKMNV